jgi:hypothetical protein
MQTPDIHTLIDQWLTHITLGTAITFFGSLTVCIFKVGFAVRGVKEEVRKEWNLMRANMQTLATQMNKAAGSIEKLSDELTDQAIVSAKIETMLETQTKWSH